MPSTTWSEPQVGGSGPERQREDTMIRRPDRFLPLVFAAALFAAVPPAAALDSTGRTELPAVKAQAQAAGRLRVVVELKVGARASRRVVNGIQRRVVATALGTAAWRQRGNHTDAHDVPEMTASPLFVATVTPAEIDKLAANPRVKRIVPEATWAPRPKKSKTPAK
jgi:hypothetical protein